MCGLTGKFTTLYHGEWWSVSFQSHSLLPIKVRLLGSCSIEISRLDYRSRRSESRLSIRLNIGWLSSKLSVYLFSSIITLMRSVTSKFSTLNNCNRRSYWSLSLSLFLLVVSFMCRDSIEISALYDGSRRSVCRLFFSLKRLCYQSIAGSVTARQSTRCSKLLFPQTHSNAPFIVFSTSPHDTTYDMKFSDFQPFPILNAAPKLPFLFIQPTCFAL